MKLVLSVRLENGDRYLLPSASLIKLTPESEAKLMDKDNGCYQRLEVNLHEVYNLPQTYVIPTGEGEENEGI